MAVLHVFIRIVLFVLCYLQQKVLIEDKQLDLQFSHWFAVDCIFTNACVVIPNVTVEEFQPPSSEVSLSFSSRSGAADDDDDDDVEDLSAVMPIESSMCNCRLGKTTSSIFPFF
jgi:hypothetical protein